jgi:hypothetical protein
MAYGSVKRMNLALILPGTSPSRLGLRKLAVLTWVSVATALRTTKADENLRERLNPERI